jgi:hypothetical protein
VSGCLAFDNVSTRLFVPVVFSAVRERLARREAPSGAGYSEAIQESD